MSCDGCMTATGKCLKVDNQERKEKFFLKLNSQNENCRDHKNSILKYEHHLDDHHKLLSTTELNLSCKGETKSNSWWWW